MSKQMKRGSLSDKTILIILAVLVVVVIAVVIIMNVSGNGKDEDVNIDAPTTVEQANGPIIPGDENIEISGSVKTNVSKALNSDKTYDIYTLTDIHLETVNGLSTLTAIVSASTSELVDGKTVRIEFYDKDGNLLEYMGAYIPQIGPDETKELRASSTTDLANVYDFKIIDIPQN